jgi:hypothetical protein
MVWQQAKGKRNIAVDLQHRGARSLPRCSLTDIEEALLERIRRQLSETEHTSYPESEPEEEEPCWWILSALEACDGKEAREAYYAGL